MKQIAQKLKNGEIRIKEVPFPTMTSGEVMLRNIYSCISIGTESGTVKAARLGYIGKAKQRPQQFKQVLEKLHHDGFIQTYRSVMKKLDALSPLGYSCVGKVIDVSSDVREFFIGDIVACGGSTASHAEIVCVPKNLCVKIKSGTDLKQAAYNTLGAIAMQGIRQADVRVGETCAVIGLGVVGQLTSLILRAGGIKTIGIEVNKGMVDIASENCADLACLRQDSETEQQILNFTNGMGCDAVVITASSTSLDPVNFAGAISRKRGTIVIVGGVPTGFDREPYFYNKELTLKMSCSYGPGRYDSEYEEKGRDYPFGYVRWTEQRNMEAFQELIASGKVDLSYLTTHVFKLDEVPQAYDMILKRKEPFIGLLIEYESDKQINNYRIEIKTSRKFRSNGNSISIGLIGAGSYAQSFLLPNIPKEKDIQLKGIMTKSSTTSRSIAEKFGFEFCTGNAKDIIENSEINTVIIATRHNSHGYYVIESLKACKNVFVEKPLCITKDELETIKNIIHSKSRNNERYILLVGYNRRFSPLTVKLKSCLSSSPMSALYRINAGFVSGETWSQDPEVGGGRILGEVCHFVDYLNYICGSTPVKVFAKAIEDKLNNADTLCISIAYENGSVASINYFANGSKLVHKEYIEIYQNGVTAIIDDFRRMSIYGNRSITNVKLRAQDKGQKEEIKEFLNAIRQGDNSIMPFEQIYSASNLCFGILESLRVSNVVRL